MLVSSIVNSKTPLFEVLQQYPETSFLKCDLYHYVELLNLFDSEMEQIIKNYIITNDAQSPQVLQFELMDKNLLILILKISRQLWENCTNRNIYNSYDRLNNLLLTCDLDVLECVLRLLLRPAQRIPSQRSLRTGLQMTAEYLKVLAFTYLYKTNNTDLQTVLDPSAKIKVKKFKFQFYRLSQSEYILNVFILIFIESTSKG